MTDLTFQQLGQALPNGSVLVLNTTDPVPVNGVYIRVGAVTGDSITALTNTGVVELMMKLFLACYDAQNQFNSSASAGQRIQAFSAPTYGQTQRAQNGEITTRINCSMTAILNVDSNVAKAPTI